MNVLFGLMHPDSGEIASTASRCASPTPARRSRHGIGMVHQHFMLVPVFTVAENIVLGFEPTRRLGFLDRDKARAEILRLSTEFGLEVDPDAARRDAPGRYPAAGRDREGPDARRPAADPGRTDRRAHPSGDRGSLHGHPFAR